MKRKNRAVFYCLFLTALFLYFYTESLLRLTVVSNVSDQDLTLSKIVDMLPSSIRDDVQYQVDISSLKDAINSAKNDSDRVIALNNMAFYVKGEEKKEEIYTQIIKSYPTLSEAADAYTYFLLKEGSPHQISIDKFINFAISCKPVQRYYTIQKGWQKIKSTHPIQGQLNYLSNLLKLTPDFKDYNKLYNTLYLMAVKAGQADLANQAKKLMDMSLTKTSLQAELNRQMLEEEKKQKTGKKQQD